MGSNPTSSAISYKYRNRFNALENQPNSRPSASPSRFCCLDALGADDVLADTASSPGITWPFRVPACQSSNSRLLCLCVIRHGSDRTTPQTCASVLVSHRPIRRKEFGMPQPTQFSLDLTSPVPSDTATAPVRARESPRNREKRGQNSSGNHQLQSALALRLSALSGRAPEFQGKHGRWSPECRQPHERLLASQALRGGDD